MKCTRCSELGLFETPERNAVRQSVLEDVSRVVRGVVAYLGEASGGMTAVRLI